MSYRVSRVLIGFLLVCSLACLIVCGIVCGMTADAWAQASAPSKQKTNNADEAAVFERILNRVRFENDGTEVSETEAVVRIQSQAGVEEFGQLVFGYSSATEKLEVQYVRVRKPDGRVVTTPESTAQDFAPDVLKEAPMYSDYRQRHISVAALQPGDTLEYRTVTRVLTPLAAGNFWYEYTFPKGVAVDEDRLEIDVPKAREVKLKTPTRQPEIQQTGDRRIYTWVVKNIQPERDKDKDKDEDEETGPDVQLTTFTGWKQVAQWYAKLQGERMTVDDSVRKKAEELTKGADTPTEKARRLYDYVARNVRYVSISLGIGRYQPHSASDVLQNGYGDCKDKHTLFSALLRAEGIQSYPVLIDSSRKLDADVPSPAQFDHVITAARLGTGPELTWLDTTPEVTPFGLILYQLRNKQAVLASEDSEGGLQRTPADSPIKTFLHFTLDGKFSEFGALDATLEVTAQGDRDWPMRASFRRFSQAQWKDFVKALSANWGLPGDVDDVQLDPIEDTSKPFHLKYRLHQDRHFIVPSASVSFRPIPPLGMPAIRAPGKSTEPLSIGPTGEMDYGVRLQFPSNYTVRTPTAVKMTRDYGDYSSTYSLSNGILEGERKLNVKINELAAARRADYESFRNATQSDQDQMLSCTILTPTGQGAETTASKMEGSPAELHKAGVKALQSKDYRTAIDLLKRAVDGDSSLKDGWYDLGLAYAGANHHADAAGAFRKQIELDPNHKHANGDLAMELQQTGKTDEAIAAYRKQLETAPYEKTAHKNLGLLLAQSGRDADARTELEAAAAIPPDDPETKMALAQVYGRLGEKALAQELMKGLTGSAGGDSGQDIFASALRNDIDPTQTENDAQQVLYDIGGQFDSGELDRLGPSAFSSMRLVALAWARMGWAKYHRGENLAAMQFLTSAWLLSQSGTVGNRLGQVLEKQGQPEKARHIYALAVAAGGSASEVQDSRTRLAKLAGDPAASEKDVAQAPAELVLARTVKLGAITSKSVSARFNLVFDSSPRPERAEFVDGDESLRSTGVQLREKDFPVRFPDVSSVKIVRRGLLSCGGSGCSVELLPIEKESAAGSVPAASKK
jgi:transglutaminase-like putative cysteine protease/tetratricopeptide (TPR) repeat protein